MKTLLRNASGHAQLTHLAAALRQGGRRGHLGDVPLAIAIAALALALTTAAVTPW